MTDYREDLNEIFEAWGDDIQSADIGEFCANFINDLQKMNEFKLYRYCPANYYALRNIAYQTIRLSSSNELNDVFEGIPQSNIKIDRHNIELVGKAAYMTCFTEDKKNWQMWGLYADSFKGICLEYDLKKLKDEKGLLKKLYPVIYAENRIVCSDFQEVCDCIRDLLNAIENDTDESSANEYCKKKLLPLFLHKNIKWQSEKEWRIISDLVDFYDAQDKNYAGQLQQFDCMTGIYLGYRIESTKKEDITNIVKILNERRNDVRKIKVYESSIPREKYDIEYSEIIV